MTAFKAVRVAATFPFLIADLMRRRAKELGYRSVSAYLLGLVLFDLWCKKPHALTLQVANDDRPEMREAVFREIADGYDEPAKPSSYFEHRLEELAREIAERREE